MFESEVDSLIKKRLVHEIHTSERRSFRSCRRRWNWIFREMYYPQVTAKPLEFGIAYHAAMEVFYDPETWSWDRDVRTAAAKAKFATVCEEQRKHYLDVVGEQYISNDEIQQDYDERLELGLGMLEYYCNQVSPRIDTNWKPLRVEVEFIVPIQNPDTGEFLLCRCDKCWQASVNYWKASHSYAPVGVPYMAEEIQRSLWQGLPVCLAGRIDCLAEDEYGHYWIVDWKTAAQLSADKDEFLYLDDQISSYVMALRRKLGLNVRGFVYHEQRKGFPQPPTRNVNIRMGRMYSVNKNQNTDYPTYLATVQEHDKEAYEAGLYDDFLEFLKNEGTVFFKRYQIHRTDTELLNIERMLYLEAVDMTDPNLSIYPNAGRFNCGFCAFRGPCLGMTQGEDYQYTLDTLYDKREHHYWEEKKLSTESQGGE